MLGLARPTHTPGSQKKAQKKQRAGTPSHPDQLKVCSLRSRYNPKNKKHVVTAALPALIRVARTHGRSVTSTVSRRVISRVRHLLLAREP
jgi:hypothetical protein